jgi:hypothetical protein
MVWCPEINSPKNLGPRPKKKKKKKNGGVALSEQRLAFFMAMIVDKEIFGRLLVDLLCMPFIVLLRLIIINLFNDAHCN